MRGLFSCLVAVLVPYFILPDLCFGFTPPRFQANPPRPLAHLPRRTSELTVNHVPIPVSSTQRASRSLSSIPASFPSSSSALHALAFDRTVAVASAAATAKLLSSIGLGGLAARQPNVLDAAAISALSRLTFWVFQPAFLMCSVSRTIFNASHGGLPTRFLLLMPLTALLQITLGGLVGQLVTSVQTFPDNEARAVRMCTTFANSGPLPLIFADALFGSSPAILSEVVACISFYLLVWSPLFWSYGRVVMGTYGTTKTASTKLRRVWDEIRKILSPPVIGSILGVIIGGLPLCRNLFFRGGILSPLWGSMQTLGTAYLPAALLVLAGSLVGPGSNNNNNNNKKAASNPTTAADTNGVNGDVSNVSTNPSARAVASIFLSRFLLAPLLSFGLLQTLSGLGLLGPVGTRARAIVTYVLLCEGCMPPNQNSVIMLQLEGLQGRAQSMAKLLTLIYSLSVVPVTILLSACLARSSIMSFL